MAYPVTQIKNKTKKQSKTIAVPACSPIVSSAFSSTLSIVWLVRWVCCCRCVSRKSLSRAVEHKIRSDG